MGRRARSNSNASGQNQQNNNTRNVHLTQILALTNPSPHPTVGGMSPSSRYSHNLKVLRRRDPSIVTIFDQFSHVCLYHHDGEKWEKKGYEGSMFLYERDAYPPYGFYILNRMGMDDYIQRMYPEDDTNIRGDYLMYKCYPDYTALRLGLPMDQRGVDPDLKNDKNKGRSITVGLWMFATESREPMKDVMMRLHDFIRRDESYPEEFRYGPDRPPPKNPHLGISDDSSSDRDENANNEHVSIAPTADDLFTGQPIRMNEIDKLFSKIVHPSQQQKLVDKTSVDTLFATALGGNSPSPSPRAASTSSNRGLALLDSIFASATPNTTNQNLPHAGTASIPSLQILSPKPTTSTLPQVLNQNVISTLLGLTPSPGGSVSSSSTNRTGYRYEGDNESTSEEGGFSEGEYSASSTVLDEELEIAAQTAAGRASINSVPSFSFSNMVADFVDENAGAPGVQGDVTPRPALKGIRTSTPPPTDMSPSNRRKEQPQRLFQSFQRRSNGTDNLSGPSGGGDRPSSVSGRPLVPFEPDSELWPYPRAPLDDRSIDTDGDVVELDFKDISVLSDPQTFQGKSNGKAGGGRKKKEKKDKEREREEIERGWDNPVVGASAAGPSVAPTISTTPQKSTPAKGKGKQVADVPVNGVTPVKKNAVSTSISKPNQTGLDHDAISTSLLATASAHKNNVIAGRTDRNEFVREILTLIHTDKTFVDKLWADYLARTA